jgi:hypothetical protein
MTDPCPPYICVCKKYPHTDHIKTWCGRDISISDETHYDTDYALDKRDPITCPKCFSEIKSYAHQPTLREYPGFSMALMIYPFIGLGLFWAAIIPGKEFANENFFTYCLPLMITSLLVMLYGTIKMLRASRQADNAAQEKLDALLEKSPNRKKDD